MVKDSRVVDGVERSDQSLVAEGGGQRMWCCVSEEQEGGTRIWHVIGLSWSLKRTLECWYVRMFRYSRTMGPL